MSEEPDPNKLPVYAKRLLSRLSGKTLCRTPADTEDAITKGGGYLYFIAPGNRKASPASSRLLIEGGYVVPQNDGLFADVSQTFRVREHA